jgi:predicted MFS family arabinose efflux permease
MLLLGLSIVAVGLLSGGLIGVYGAVLVALFLVGLGKAMFDPAIQAYVGERVSYRRRGLVIGMMEFSWAGSFLIGIPFAGLLIDRLGWRAPFFALGGLCLLGVAAIGLLIPSDRRRRHPAVLSPGFRETWRLLSRDRGALGALGFAFLLNVGNESLFVNYGVWLEDAFTLGVVAIGTASTTIGIAELVGEGFTAFVADRVGLKRAVIVGLSLAMLSYFTLPFIGQTLPLALVGLFMLFLTFEFTVVTAYSLFTEVLPRARGTMMAALTAVSGLGRVLGALVGGAAWQTGGLMAVCLVAAVLSLMALACFGWGLWHWRD